MSLLESNTLRKNHSLAGLEMSGQAVYSHHLSQAEQQYILTSLAEGCGLSYMTTGSLTYKSRKLHTHAQFHSHLD